MRVSRYNYFKPWDDNNFLAYNARSGGVALMTKDNYALYLKLTKKINARDTDHFSPEEADLLTQLKHGSFIYDGEQDELEDLHFKHNAARYDRTVLNLAIAPTMACNLACRYCYEDNKKGRMSGDIIEKIIGLVEEQTPGLRELNIAWYGGEPLLAMDIIEDLSQSFFDIQKEHKFQYASSMISNGYLLNKEKVDRLCELKVLEAQITLDGPEKYHDLNRPLKNGGGSFRTIIENLKYAADKIRLNIRVNVDKNTSIDNINELLRELDQAGLREKIGVNFGHLEAMTSACSNIAESCYNIVEFSKAEVDYYGSLLANGYVIGKLPLPSVITCMSQNINSYLIDPEGRLYKCFANLGDPSKAMGYIGKEIEYGNHNFTSLFQFNPFLDEECRQCAVLPVCLGGCPEKRTHPELKKEERCSSWKHNLEPMLEIIAYSRQQKNPMDNRS
jgi:uncharacterized protein